MKKSLNVLGTGTLAFALLLGGCSSSATTPSASNAETKETAEAAETAETEETAEPEKDSPWTVNDQFAASIDADAEELFEKSAEGMIGCKNTPIASLASQVVNGTNNVFLAYTEFELEGFERDPAYTLVFSNTDAATGETKALGYVDLDLDDLKVTDNAPEAGLLGGWEVNTALTAQATTEECDVVMTKALEAYTGLGDIKPIVLLGTGTFAGTNYKVLAEATTVTAEPSTNLYVFTFSKDLNDNCTVEQVKVLDLGGYFENVAGEAE